MNWRSLAKQSEFQKVYGEGTKRVGRLVVVYLLCADDFGSAVVASRKVGGAVQRNRAKRLLREARRLGSLSDESKIIGIKKRFFSTSGDNATPGSSTNGTHNALKDENSGLWVVLVARHRILRSSALEVREELEQLLKSI